MRIAFGITVGIAAIAGALLSGQVVTADATHTVSRTGSQINIDWNDIPDATSYTITPIQGGITQTAVQVAVSAYLAEDVMPNISYTYRVDAMIETILNEGTSEEETTVTTQELFTTEPIQYGMANLSVASELSAYNVVTLTYDTVYGANEYEIYRSTNKTSGFKRVATVTGTSYANSGLALNTTYYYKVRGVQTTPQGTYYTNWSATISKRPILGKTKAKVATTSYGATKLTFTKVDGATGYKIYRSTSAKKGFKQIATVKGTSYTAKSLKTGTRYYFKVVPYKGKVNATSNTVSAKPYLKKTTSVWSSSSLTSVKVSWKKVAGANGYNVYRATSKNGTYKRVATVKGGSRTSYTNTKLKSNKVYYYTVKAYRNVGSKKVYSGSSEKERARTPIAQGTRYFSKSAIVVLEAPKGVWGDWYVCKYKSKCGIDSSYSVLSDSFLGRAYVYVPAGHYLKFESSYGKKKTVMRYVTDRFDDDFKYNKKSFSAAGHYWVGLDIAPGWYRIYAPVDNAVYKCGAPSCLWFTDFPGDDIELLNAGESIDWYLEEGMFVEVSRNPGVIVRWLGY